uniref:NADH-ubiquinone oxidoreductase chain 2 n=2 Tax=Pseudogekko smaragdinus TaxID=1183066 RepID=J7G625_9SAUR|nr:NADH dehydrogenase subunit 2 [Pseudogekko smaragdinus]AFS17342.1 NADH dehydrogenase subunit 2 [Pseudogekko smaragdinus]
MSPMIWALLITTLSTSTIIVMSSHHWLLAWIGLELNTLSILPLIMKSGHPRATESATKYFLIQATAAALVLFAATMNAWEMGHWHMAAPLTPLTATTISLAIMLKLGLAPMHAWYPEVLQGSTFTTALIISTWQKLAPLTLLYLMNNQLPTKILLLVSLTSTLIAGWTGLNQTQTRKILAFSSIAHMGWLLAAMSLNPNLAILTLLIYIMMTTTMFMALNTTTMKTLTDLGTTWTQSPALTALTILTLFSLGGLPPLTGFLPKWLILHELCYNKLVPLAMMLALASLPSLYFYIRMTYLTVLTIPPNTTNIEHKWRFNSRIVPLLPATMTLTALLLPMAPMLTSI